MLRNDGSRSSGRGDKHIGQNVPTERGVQEPFRGT
jgi:hypothetical protein